MAPRHATPNLDPGSAWPRFCRLRTAMANYRSAFSLRLLGIAAVMASAACVPTEPPAVGAPQAAALADASPSAPRSSAYVDLLRLSGIEMAIPSTGKFILVNIPSYELVALQDGEPVLRS